MAVVYSSRNVVEGEYICQVNGHNKWWSIHRSIRLNQGDYYVEYGAIGRQPTGSIFYSTAQAIKKVQEKLNKGYILKHVPNASAKAIVAKAQASEMLDELAGKKTRKKREPKEKLPPPREVTRFITMLTPKEREERLQSALRRR